MEREVTLEEVLRARETRAQRQQELLRADAPAVVSFTMNIAGPVKNGAGLRRAFALGAARLRAAAGREKIEICAQELRDLPTGCEGLFTLRADGRRVKALCIALEDEDALGRLFDLDVLDAAHGSWSRTELGFGERGCLICGAAGKNCASRRVHSAAEVRAKTDAILREHFARQDGERIASLALRALLTEACTTPKPGLVDCANSGSHRDMDLFTFLASASALAPYLQAAVRCGQDTAALAPRETFALLRREGRRAEEEMLRASGGVNTHKGAVFSVGVLCAAAGRLWTAGGPCRDVSRLLKECAAMTKRAVEDELAALTVENADTAGARLYLREGLRGIRGEVAEGLPSAEKIGLPALRGALARGLSLEEAGALALLRLMAGVTDTNLLKRGGWEAQRWVSRRASALLADMDGFDRAAIEAFDREMIARNLSPGGCADLLAISYFLYFLASGSDAPERERSGQ